MNTDTKKMEETKKGAHEVETDDTSDTTNEHKKMADTKPMEKKDASTAK